MSVQSAIAHFRVSQASLFVDAATVYRPTTGGTLGVGNVWVPTVATILYAGPCLMRAFTWEGTTVESADQQVRLRRLTGKFPVNTDIEKDDVVVASASTYDTSLVGVGFRVTDVFRDGFQICRRCILEEITE
jgi:translation initiation factor IF-1